VSRGSLGLLLAAGVVAAACTSSAGGEPGGPTAAPRSSASATATVPSPTGVTESPDIVAVEAGSLEAAACAMPHEQLVRVWRGTDPNRSGQIALIPREPNFLGSNFPHSGPWDYLQDVPLFWYGPGVIPAVGPVDRATTLADVPPTQAALLGFPFDAPNGRRLREIPATDTPPALIVTLVWDAGGMSVLDAFPNDWPVLRSLIEGGVWYERATVGSSPSITPATHATLGTGAFPMLTGQTDAEFRIGPDLIRAGALGPVLLMEPTLGDLYDRTMGNEPLVGALASVTWHLNMASHGSLWGGGDKDIAVLRVPSAADNEGAEGTIWNLQGRNEAFFRFPEYVNDLPPLSSYADEIDEADGALDGRWRDNSIEQYEEGWATPARIPYQGRMVEEVIAREGFGDDDVPDLLFINFKAIDHVSHIWSVNSPEMQDTLRWQDEDLGRFVDFLDDEVGQGRWVLVLTADHGAQFDPAVSGAFQVTPGQLEQDLEAAFPSSTDRSVFQAVRTSQVYVNEPAMEASGYTFEQIARFLTEYTKEQGASDPSTVPEAERDDRFFSAAFPIEMLPDLPCLPEARA
jgi:Type I phosphodiesterase / nucleotide pyrophosphatase